MSSPLESPNFKTLYVGDERDDDAQIIDEYTTMNPDGPPKPYTEPIPDQSVALPIVSNRLIAGFLTIDPTWPKATPILTRDENRIMLMVKAISTTATDGISFADDINSLTAIDPLDTTRLPKFGARIFNNDGWVNLGPYTGALVATAFGAAAPVGFSWISVTK